MKRLPSLLVLTLLPFGGLYAQAPVPAAPTPSVSTPAEAGPGKKWQERRKERMDSLTPEEQGKLKAARKAALDSPEVRAAQASRETNKKGYRLALRAAMIRQDPSIVGILAKLKGQRKQERIF